MEQIPPLVDCGKAFSADRSDTVLVSIFCLRACFEETSGRYAVDIVVRRLFSGRLLLPVIFQRVSLQRRRGTDVESQRYGLFLGTTGPEVLNKPMASGLHLTIG